MNYIFLILSIFTGMGIVYLLKPRPKSIGLLLSFSGAYLLSITLLHLLPEIYANHSTNDLQIIGLYILLGILVQSILESLSKGAEHGHIHTNTPKLKQFPWGLFIALNLHAFSEGMPLGHGSHSLLWAIVLHKVPVSILLTSFFTKNKLSFNKIFFFISIFALSSPAGAFITDTLPLLNQYQTQITAFSVGIFLHISTIILLESSKNHTFNIVKFIVTFLAFILGAIDIFLDI